MTRAVCPSFGVKARGAYTVRSEEEVRAAWKHPRDARGHFVPLDCPNAACSAGRLMYEGNGWWTCDGLADPGDPRLEVDCCPMTHMDGTAYEPIKDSSK